MVDLQDFQFRLEYAGLRLLALIMRLLGVDRGAAVSAVLWRFFAPMTRRHKRALENLALAYPEKSAAEHRRIALAMWGNLGRVMAETMQIDRILADPERLQFANEALDRHYVGKLGSLIGVSLHTGNWEFAIWPMIRWGAHPGAVYRLVKNPYVDRYIRDQRKALFPAGMLAKGRDHEGSNLQGQRTARQLTSFVRRGGRLGLICDLYDKHGIATPFFGHDARSTPVPAMIARRVGSRIWMARCIRLGERSQFRIEVKELKVRRTDRPSDDIRWITAEMQRQFETWIREYPEQWMWSNRRWS